MCEGVIIMLYSSPSTPGYKYEWFKDGIDMGVDTTEQRVAANPHGGHAGWVLVKRGTGGRAGRVQVETLVAMGSMTGDGSASANDDTTFADA